MTATPCQPRPCNIAYIINQYPYVSHTFIKNEIAALEEAGFDVLRIAVRGWDAVSVDASDDAERRSTKYLLDRGLAGLAGPFLRTLFRSPLKTLRALTLSVKLSRGSDRSLPYHLIYLAEACKALALTRRHGSRHVHAHFGSNSAEVAMLLHKLGGPPFSFTVHGPEEFDRPIQLKIREKVAASTFVVAVSYFGRSQMYRFASEKDWSKIRVVHCGLGPDYLAAEQEEYSGTHRLVCVGRLCEQKGQLILLRACAILKERNISFEVVLIGDGEMRDAVEKGIKRLGLDDEVKIAGWLSSNEIRIALRASKGLVLPSFAEGLPVVIMEAMSLGRPVVSTYVAGIPELVRNDIEGFLAIAGNELDLADAMERLLTLDKDTFVRMGSNARKRVAQRHDAVTEAEKLGSLFRESVLSS